MERAEILSSLAASGTDTAPERLTELADELDIPAADLLVVAGHPVPAELLPPERDAKVMRQFAYRVSHCNHSQLALLEGFVRSLPRVAASAPFVQPTSPYHRPAETGFGAELSGLIRNRGFGIRELPFTGLSLSTLFGMVSSREPSPHRRYQLCALAGPLGWTLSDLFAVANEPHTGEIRPVQHCHHPGRVFAAVVSLTTAQLIEAAADETLFRRLPGLRLAVPYESIRYCTDTAPTWSCTGCTSCRWPARATPPWRREAGAGSHRTAVLGAAVSTPRPGSPR
ncbi:hypothetical protein ACFV1W_22550 [Kitasatospora sp. NPDC059648]|uniref:hypothetical protein n=1 Tax=Kitasatospora sp. NPDC059648 TaxID=3346894 RepID=UPI0036D13E1A